MLQQKSTENFAIFIGGCKNLQKFLLVKPYQYDLYKNPFILCEGAVVRNGPQTGKA